MTSVRGRRVQGAAPEPSRPTSRSSGAEGHWTFSYFWKQSSDLFNMPLHSLWLSNIPLHMHTLFTLSL